MTNTPSSRDLLAVSGGGRRASSMDNVSSLVIMSMGATAFELETLRVDASTPFDDGNEEHVALLQELWVAAGLGSGESFASISPVWQRLGFQGDDPMTDLRGAGLLGLRQLLHFVQSGSGSAELVGRRRRASGPYPLTSASLNVTLLLCRHLRLHPALPGGFVCTESQRLQLLRLQLPHRVQGLAPPIDLVHEALLRVVLDRWRALGEGGAASTALHFPAVLASADAHLQRTLAELAEPWSIASLVGALRRDDADDQHVCYAPWLDEPWSVALLALPPYLFLSAGSLAGNGSPPPCLRALAWGRVTLVRSVCGAPSEVGGTLAQAIARRAGAENSAACLRPRLKRW